ncbi:MAG: MarR family transcriptional regulator [Clostridia bacterium]|nr:MarR family transcriptional regulator [Clostridia bacterium]
MDDSRYEVLDFLDEDMAYGGIEPVQTLQHIDNTCEMRVNTAQDMMQEYFLLRQYFDRCIGMILAKYGLFDGQPQLLLAIKNSNMRLTQNKLAETVGVGRASVGASLRRLEKSGFVRRVRDSSDSRCIYVELTYKGSEFVRWCEIDFQMLFSTMLESFDPEERVLIPEYIARINASLKGLYDRLNT